jgi:hypothetical protein
MVRGTQLPMHATCATCDNCDVLYIRNRHHGALLSVLSAVTPIRKLPHMIQASFLVNTSARRPSMVCVRMPWCVAH